MAKSKAERLEEALRANLKKRRAQEQARAQKPGDPLESLEPEANPR